MKYVISLVVIAALIAVFYIVVQHQSVVVVSPSPSPTASSDQFCHLTTDQSLTVYSRAASGSPVFGTIDQQENPIIGAKTADGWVGFDPGVAQAPNVGPFRLRWIAPGASYTLSGSCNALPVMPNLPPTACFTMSQTDIPVYSSPNETSTIIATMRSGDYSKVIGQTGKTNLSWVKIDTSVGTLAGTKTGWISMQNVNFNGQDCNSLPIVTK